MTSHDCLTVPSCTPNPEIYRQLLDYILVR